IILIGGDFPVNIYVRLDISRSTKGFRPVFSIFNALPTRSWLLRAIYVYLLLNTISFLTVALPAEKLNVFHCILSPFTTRQNVIVLDIWACIAALPAPASITLKNCCFYMFRDTLCVWIRLEFDKVPFPDTHSSS